MKKTPLFVASAIVLTLGFYLAAYYMLPGDPPSAAMVGLFAAAALIIVWACNALWSRRHAPKATVPGPEVTALLVWIGLGLLGLSPHTNSLVAQTRPSSTVLTIECSASPSTVSPGGSTAIFSVATSPLNRPLRYSYSASAGQISGNASSAILSTAGAPPGAIAVICSVSDDTGQTASNTAIVSVAAPATPSPRLPSQGTDPVGGGGPPSNGSRGLGPPRPGGGRPPAMDRVTGTAVLLAGHREPTGYGLYSYALLSHPPSDAEFPRYRAFLKALVALPTAQALSQYISPSRINVTSIPLTVADPDWERDAADVKVAFILNGYDYARSAALRASLPMRLGAGPVLLSVLSPINLAEQPSPVLVQDMSMAQATLMSAYVQAFVSQAAQQRFWQESTLTQFSLGLRNSLEVAAAGLNLSQTAVDGWIKVFK